MGYTLKEIKNIRKVALCANLENRELLWKYRNFQLQSLCNGIGPACFPEWARKLVSAMNPTLEPAAAIHDLEWLEGNGTIGSFFETNRRLRRNGWKLARKRYAWFDPRRYFVMHQACRFERLCNLFGWAVWSR